MRPAERESKWRERIGRWQTSGLSGRQFCAREGLYLKSFYGWRRRFAGQPGAKRKARNNDLVPVRLVEPAGDVRIEIGSAAIVVTVQSSATALRTALAGFGVVLR